MILIAIFLILVSIMILVDWIVHILIVKSNSNNYGWANYRRFKKEFAKAKWAYNRKHSSSLESVFYGVDKFHANIIRFNHIGMIIKNPISFMLCKLYVRKYIKNNFKVDEIVNKWR